MGKYLILLLALMFLSLGAYVVHLTKSLTIEQENNRQLHQAIDRQQSAIKELEENYSQVITITQDIAQRSSQREQARENVLSKLEQTKDVKERERVINDTRREYNRCVTQISSSAVLDACAPFLVPVKP